MSRMENEGAEMADQRRNRLRMVALTGVLTPGLMLGAAGAVGFGVLSGGMAPATVAAQAIVDGGACPAFAAPPAGAEMSVADVAEKVNPAVVTIVNLQPMSQVDMSGFPGIEGIPGLPELPGIGELPGSEAPDGDDDSSSGVEGAQQIEGAEDEDTLVPAGTGSGFIVDDIGHVITNAHVVDGAEELTVSLFDGTEIPAKVVGKDDIIDVAVLELDLPAGQAVPGIVPFGDSAALRAGDEVVAIGTALGSFPNTVSEGTVNATNRAFPPDAGLTTMIQHDAEIWHGNSGGPLLNLVGQVVGINTAGIGSGMMGADTGSADMAFAVEGNTICNAAAELIENGEIIWPYLGIQGEASADGQTIVEVVEDGPSAEAGLEAGDVITALDGQEIGRETTLIDLLFGHEVGDVVGVTVDRDGDVQTFSVTLGERPTATE
jgi:S1-C subfamily serine protease